LSELGTNCPRQWGFQSTMNLGPVIRRYIGIINRTILVRVCVESLQGEVIYAPVIATPSAIGTCTQVEARQRNGLGVRHSTQ